MDPAKQGLSRREACEQLVIRNYARSVYGLG